METHTRITNKQCHVSWGAGRSLRANVVLPCMEHGIYEMRLHPSGMLPYTMLRDCEGRKVERGTFARTRSLTGSMDEGL